MKVNYIIILFGLLLLSGILKGSTLDHDSLLYILEEHQDDSIAAQALIDFAGDIIDDFPDSAFLYLEDAEEIAEDINNTYLLAVIHAQEGLIFDKMNEYADALEQYFQAKKDIESDQDFRQDSASRMIYLQVLNQLGVLYFKIDKFDEAREYLKSVILFMQENGMEPNNETCINKYLRTYINLGAVNIRQRKFTEAEINYTKALTLLDESDVVSYAVILNNLGIIAKEQEEYDKAFDYHRRALKIREEEQNYHGIAQSYNNLGATYFISGDMESARIYVEKSLKISLENNYLPSAVISLEYLKQIYEGRKDFEKAFAYQAQFLAINDSLMNQEKLRAISQLEMQDKFDTRVRESQHRQEKTEAEQRKKEIIYLLITAASVLGILILVLIYFLQRSKMKRQMLETRKNNLEVKGLELENINLERELEFRTKELTTNVMYMARTSEFITRISEKLLRSKMYFTQDNQEVINKVITELQSYIDQDTWAEFEIRFQQVHNDFYTKLNELHPDLTANEKKLCAFLRLNMTTKEISAITYQSVNSIIVARSRLRKKLGIDRDENLVSYLENL
ncbi:MAG: tetratricopeptide repeat protein [Bacteroidales bacterium]|nr:tetratricopeptide repeat protein [Bacteroidales bacterium]